MQALTKQQEGLVEELTKQFATPAIVPFKTSASAPACQF